MAVPAAVPFSIPQEVAIRIYAACKGVGTKEEALIDAMTTIDDVTVRCIPFLAISISCREIPLFRLRLFSIQTIGIISPCSLSI
jgi:hypothetical protein